jgi:hypothetical protein
VASFCHAVWDAMMIAETPTYDSLAANCARAREAEINWPYQFDKFAHPWRRCSVAVASAPPPRRRDRSPIPQRTRGRLADRRRTPKAANGGA